MKWHTERDQLYSASYDDTIKCWTYENSVDEWICAYTMTGGHASTVWCFDFDNSGSFLVSCSEDKTWTCWSITNKDYKKLGQVQNTHFRAIYSISWCPKKDANWIATAGADNQIIIHDIPEAQLSQPAENPFQPQLLIKLSSAHSTDINCI